MLVREAGIGDAEALAAVHVRSWKAAYQGLVPQDYLDSLQAADRFAMWHKALSEPPPGDRTLVAHDGDEILGFVNIGASRDEDAGGAGELRAFYFAPEHWGRGNGRRMIETAVGLLGDAGFERLTLWVLDSNVRAKRFYERNGWRHDGTTRVDAKRGFPVSEQRYTREARDAE